MLNNKDITALFYPILKYHRFYITKIGKVVRKILIIAILISQEIVIAGQSSREFPLRQVVGWP